MNGSTVLIADDDAAIRTVLSQSLGRAGYDVRTAATAAGLWNLIEAGEGSIVVTDVVLPDGNGFDLIPRIREARPGLPIVVMSARNTILTAISAAEHGAFEYLPKPFDLKDLTSTVSRALDAPHTKFPHPGPDEKLPLIGHSPAMQDIYRSVARLTRSDVSVLITGESGTGKELAARAIHDYGMRRRGPFVAVNAASIPRDLVESELFGHERGAFTGATTRGVGRFAQAEGGTLFLDEIGDMPLEAQTRLLRVLQEGEYSPVGAREFVRTNVRIIAATNRELTTLIGQGQFREDLYYRLNVVPLRMPPLRERSEDIPDLVKHFLIATRANKQFEPGAMELCQRHGWPGNVRELENLVRRLVVLHPEEKISADVVVRALGPTTRTGGGGGADLGQLVEQYLARHFRSQPGGMPPRGLYDRVLTQIERPLLTLSLAATGGNQLRAADLLGLNRNTLRKKLREHGLDVARGTRAD